MGGRTRAAGHAPLTGPQAGARGQAGVAVSAAPVVPAVTVVQDGQHAHVAPHDLREPPMESVVTREAAVIKSAGRVFEVLE